MQKIEWVAPSCKEYSRSFLEKVFLDIFGHEVQKFFFAPGRVNIIGEHIDYNGGMVLPFAIKQGIYALVRFRNDQTCRFASMQFPDIYSLNNDELITSNCKSWIRYPVSMFELFKEQGLKLSGMDILFFSDLPTGSGLSSSAAILVLTGYILNVFLQKPFQSKKLGFLAQEAEQRFIGLNCGIMDQLVIAAAHKDKGLLIDCHTIQTCDVPLHLQNYEFVIFNSRKPRNLVDSAYNDRFASCQTLLSRLKEPFKIEFLANITPEQLDEALALFDDSILKKRLRHVVTEQARVKAVVHALEHGDLNKLGELLNQSHISLAKDYEVSCPELDILVQALIKHDSVAGARMTGAGFGGCCIALVKKEAIDLVIADVLSQYEQNTPYKAQAYVACSDAGVREI